MEKILTKAVLFFFLASSLYIIGCKPPYPKCEKDDHCEEQKEVCVMGKCQQCRDDSNCPEGYICKDYTCVPKPECTSDAECTEPLICKNEKCVPECTTDADCQEGMTCENQRCKPVGECTTDEDCEQGNTCLDGTCQPTDKVGTDGTSGTDDSATSKECVLEKIHFDFDRYTLRSGARDLLEKNFECLRDNANWKVTLEGHCDERGTIEYNFALGERRARAARDYLVSLGIERNRVKIISYGEERPVVNESYEDAWSSNRRVEFVLTQQ